MDGDRDTVGTWQSAIWTWLWGAGNSNDAVAVSGAGHLASGTSLGDKTAISAAGTGLRAAGELTYGAASDAWSAAWPVVAATSMTGAGYLASGASSGVNMAIAEAKAHPTAATAIGGAAIGVAAAPVALASAGFGSAGVTAGSAAAGWQASIGNVAAGSLFATCQSAGAAGMASTTYAAVGSAGAAVGAALCKAVGKTTDSDK